MLKSEKILPCTPAGAIMTIDKGQNRDIGYDFVLHIYLEKEAVIVSNAFVICMGMGVVFVGLICIVLLVELTGRIVQTIEKKAGNSESTGEGSAPAKLPEDSIPNRGALVAAISAALAEELGTSVAGLRILSIKKMN